MECPTAVDNKYKWYSKRASPYRESRAEMNEYWRRVRHTERFELRRLLWKRYCMVSKLTREAIEHDLFKTENFNALY